MRDISSAHVQNKNNPKAFTGKSGCRPTISPMGNTAATITIYIGSNVTNTISTSVTVIQ